MCSPIYFSYFPCTTLKIAKKCNQKCESSLHDLPQKKLESLVKLLFFIEIFPQNQLIFLAFKKRSTISYFALFWYFYSTLFWYILPCAHLGPVNEVRSQLHTECVHFSMQTPWLKQDSSVQWCLVLVLVFGLLDPNFGFLDDFFGFSSWICANYEMDWWWREREREKKVEGINKFISAIFSRYMSAQKAKYGAYFLVLLNKIISCTFFNIIVGIVLMKTEQLYYRNITKPVNLTSASFQHMFRWNKSIFQGISSFSTNIQICQTSLKFF